MHTESYTRPDTNLSYCSDRKMTIPALTIIESDQPEKWQQILSDLITDPKELLQILELDPAAYPGSQQALTQFPLKAPRPFVARMGKGNWQDPLLLQVLPTRAEELTAPDLVPDPLGEKQVNPVSGLLHKYAGRVLLTTVPHCAIHCRYCFRRHFAYGENTPSRGEWVQVVDYIRRDSSIAEVILSGGDPLAASDRYLDWLISQISAIPHVTTLRLHTRLPVVIPQRVTSGLLQVLRPGRLKLVLVLHCNHANELDDEVAASLNAIANNGVLLLNQSVLLKDVNDNLPALVNLSKALFQQHVLPYYLHLPDKVAGTAHFQVSRQQGRRLIRQMQQQLPGYLVPHLVREQAGAAAKIRLA